MYVGTQEHPQYLIVDTGSAVAAMPCKEICTQCGNHLNGLYEINKSTKHSFLDCSYRHCQCVSGNKCRFYQGYAEGSTYDGYVAEDQVIFGKGKKKSPFMFRFGCVKKETKYFYTQKVDGILGLSRAENYRTRQNGHTSIYK